MDLPRLPAPRFARVRQALPTERLADPRRTCRERLLPLLRERVRPGHRIGITAGSRGIGGFQDLLNGAIDAVRALRAEPFILPAMGSHGGATADGQAAILHRLGVDEERVPAPLRATMETVELGAAPNGGRVHLNRAAAEADGVIVIGRVKTHPESAGELASGLLKMATIGLGSQAGAQQAHSHGLWESVVQFAGVLLAKAPILAGVVVVENAFRQPLVIEALPPSFAAWHEADRRLLKVAKAHLATLPVAQLDLLVVDELGKNHSGAGLDPNVIGRWRVDGGPKRPNYRRIAALSLSPESLGNGIGAGLCDFVTRRFAEDYDPHVTYVNVLTATEPDNSPHEGPLPLALDSDRAAIEVGLYSALAGASPRVVRIRNTNDLAEFEASEALMPELREQPRLSVLSEPEPLPFDAAGNLLG